MKYIISEIQNIEKNNVDNNVYLKIVLTLPTELSHLN